jgi:uncharacterized protein YciI
MTRHKKGIRSMGYYAVRWTYTKDAAKVDAARQPHVDYLKKLVADGTVAVAGGWTDGTGGLVIFDVVGRAELAELLERDPFSTDGVIVDTKINEWKVALGSIGT